MDPLSALSIANGIVAFLDFASKLISTGTEIHQSLDGATLENVELEKVYQRMLSISISLQALPVNSLNSITPGLLNVDLDGLKTLVTGCRKDCEELINSLVT